MVPSTWGLYNTRHPLVTSRTDATNLCQPVALLVEGSDLKLFRHPLRDPDHVPQRSC